MLQHGAAVVILWREKRKVPARAYVSAKLGYMHGKNVRTLETTHMNSCVCGFHAILVLN
jgi:hypothetical protein